MNYISTIPLELRLIILFLLGIALGSATNLAVYALAWNRRPISPWMRAHPAAHGRRWLDRVPVFGWLSLRRDAAIFGTGFWIRPMLVELFCGVGLVVLYSFTVRQAALFPAGLSINLEPERRLVFPAILHEQFISHVVFFWLMLVASLIDLDEKTIPDAVSRPGTLLALIIAAVWPWSLLPNPSVQQVGGWDFEPLRITSEPGQWPALLNGSPNFTSLAIALACWLFWCIAVMPRTWYARHGFLRAMKLCFARLVRQADAYIVSCLFLLGTLFIFGLWLKGADNWSSLLSSLVGMAVGGGIIWAVRIIGSAVLNQEAMGFGDVTLMSMIGAFLGWQCCLIVFFLAPFAAIIVGLLRYIIIRDKEIPYGPFLCLASLVVVLFWDRIWERAFGIFTLGWYIPLVMLACLAFMIPLLFLLRMIFNAIHALRG